MTLTADRSMPLTAASDAALPRNTEVAGSAFSAAAMPRTSAAVSGSRGSIANWALSTRSVRGRLRSRRPRMATRVEASALAAAYSCCLLK